MGSVVTMLVFMSYLGILFGVAYLVEKRGRLGRSLKTRYNYALSLMVYCTAWTFFGSVGKAANDGLTFLPIYLGPLMLAPLWPTLMHKIIRISKAERLTSLADFLSSRYGKSRSLGVLAATLLVIFVIPYLSIQLKAIAVVFDQLATGEAGDFSVPFYADSALWLTIVLVIFIGVFGVKRLDANQRHEGVIAAISFEVIFKLVAFLTVGVFIIFVGFNGLGEVFRRSASLDYIARIFSFADVNVSGWDWFWLNLVSMCAFVLLPRQFHVAVVENETPAEVDRAAWVYPTYLFIINLFVLPIAAAGLLIYGEGGLVIADAFMISIPRYLGFESIAIVATLGGFAAATGMLIMSTIALSLMISNNIILPFLLAYEKPNTGNRDLSKPLLNIRRLIIFVVFLLAYGYYKGVAAQYSLVAIGLISFTGVAQFAPALLSALYWRGASRRGVNLGLIAGTLVWAYTLALPTMLIEPLQTSSILTDGPFGWTVLRPQALFGMENVNPIAHGAFWSLLANGLGLVIGSLLSKQGALEMSQAAYFVDHHKYDQFEEGYQTRRQEAKVIDLQNLLARFVGNEKAGSMLTNFSEKIGEPYQPKGIADQRLFSYVEQQLVGAIGSASSQVLLRSITEEKPIQLEEVIKILRRTQEAVRYGRVLERKQLELEELTTRLKMANHRLQELDGLKAEFISTVTHELRTPITSIKSLARILLDTPEITDEQRATFLRIVVSESERLARLVSQVLDVQKLESGEGIDRKQLVELNKLVSQCAESLGPLAELKNISFKSTYHSDECYTLGPPDRLLQVLVNLVGNAIKFCPDHGGEVNVEIRKASNLLSEKVINLGQDFYTITVTDNGPGIPPAQRDFIFDRFTQVHNVASGKPSGSGLGLYISRKIAESCGGSLVVDPTYHQGASFILSLPYYTKDSIIEPLPKGATSPTKLINHV